MPASGERSFNSHILASDSAFKEGFPTEWRVETTDH
jgi:hypothetical protein